MYPDKLSSLRQNTEIYVSVQHHGVSLTSLTVEGSTCLVIGILKLHYPRELLLTARAPSFATPSTRKIVVSGVADSTNVNVTTQNPELGPPHSISSSVKDVLDSLTRS